MKQVAIRWPNPSSLLLCILLLASDVGAAMAQRPSLKAGAAAVEISPQTLPALWNGGFLQKSGDRVLDPLHARSLVLTSGDETIAIVVVDSCMFPTSLCDEIKRLATGRTGIPGNRILISATHTHTAPSAMSMCLGCDKDNAYVKFVAPQVAHAIADAHENLKPAKVGWKIVDGSYLTNCRRWITRSDRMGIDPFGQQTVRAMMHPGYQNAAYTSPSGPIDPWLSVLSVVAEDDTPICVMANLSMHYFGGGGFSADYFGEVARLLENRIRKASGKSSPNFVGVMSQGTSGDLHWMDYSKPRRGISRQQYSETVADRILQSWKDITYHSNVSLAMAEQRLKIGRRLPSKQRLEWARPINAARGERPAKNRTEVYAQQAEWIRDNPVADIVLQAVRIGELGINAIPNEVYGITGLKLKRQSPLQNTFNLELANGATGYIPPPEQHRLGGYTTWPARTAGLVEEAEPQIVETLLTLLEKVAQKKRRPMQLADSEYSSAVNSHDPIAYWRLDDMTVEKAGDSMGRNHAAYVGGVALFLPGVRTGDVVPQFQSQTYGSRSVYLAGGHIRADVDSFPESTVALWFRNALPVEALETTGVLMSRGDVTLEITGKAAGEDTGKLRLRVGTRSLVGKTPVTRDHWQHVAVCSDGNRLRVYLDGKPEIDEQAGRGFLSGGDRQPLLIGSDGNSTSSFDGKVDELAVFRKALTQGEVASLYKAAGIAPPPRPNPIVVLGSKPTDAKSRALYAAAVNKSEPVAYWRLHDAQASIAEDSTGDHNAKYEAAASPLKVGKPNFTGGRVKAQLAGLGNTYSVELWFRNELPVESRAVTAYMFSRAEDDETHGAFGDNLGLGGTHSNTGRLIVFAGNQADRLLAGRTKIPQGSWAHVVMVRENQKVTVYLNGDPEPEIHGQLPIDYPPDGKDILLGGRADNFANLQGMLEEVAVYKRALKPNEVADHFAAAGARPTTKVVEANVDEPTPTEPAAALKTIHVRDGFTVQLVAADPLVKDPVAIDWGSDGKLWVVEMADYPEGIDGKFKPGGRVRFLEDTDNDGQYDRSTLFSEGLSFPNGVLAWRKGILVTAAPQIVYLEDTTGDGKADLRRVLYSGFLEGNQQLRVNGLRWGLDNWIYCASGSHHGGYGKYSQITSHVTGTKHAVGSRDFRIRPGTGALDPQSGPSQYGRNRDDWGNWFGVQNSYPLWHYVLADHHIRRNPHFAPPDPKHVVITPTNPPVYPAKTPQKRFHSFNQSGRFTSACSAMIYRDELLFDRGAEQHAFTCEPFHNLVQHNLIKDDGVSFSFRRDPAEEGETDFFASEDRWCRPVMARIGPGGALWIVDMYRYMIEHPQWLPENGKNELRPWYRSGEDRGRIYRIVRSDRPARKVPSLAQMSATELVATLESPNGWQRDTAHRLLVSSPDKLGEIVPALRKLVAKSKEPLGRLHALCVLDGIDELRPETLMMALNDPHPGVRRNAIRIAARTKVDVATLAGLVNDPDAKVRLELATTLGAYDHAQAAEALVKLAVGSSDDRYINAAVMTSLMPQNVSKVLRSLGESAKGSPTASEFIGSAIAMGDKETIALAVDWFVKQQSAATRKFQDLSRILNSLSARKLTVEQLSDTTANEISSTIEAARTAANDDQQTEAVRIAALGLLGRDPHRQADFELMKQLLVPRSSASLQLAVVDQLARHNEPSVAEILLSGWRSHSPGLRARIVNILASRPQWVQALAHRLESGTVRPGELNPSAQQRLIASAKDKPRWRKLLAAQASTDRAAIIKQFEPALKLSGNVKRGELVFRKNCLNCHKLGNDGHEVGPQLKSITNKTKQSLLTSILDPSAAVEAKYYNYTVLTDGGRTFSGRLETETGTSITLVAAEGKRQTILRRDIEELQASGQSLMPNGIEKELKPQDISDLIQFILTTFR